jgi:DNA-binding XRE family transcriptional regulator
MDAVGVWPQVVVGVAYDKGGTGVSARQTACATAFKQCVLHPVRLTLLNRSGTLSAPPAEAQTSILIVRGHISPRLLNLSVVSKTPDILMRFGKRVRGLRKKAGFSQEQFAQRCELDRTYVGGIERGERNVSLRNIEVLARALSVSVSELTKGF